MSLRLLLMLSGDAGLGEFTEYESVDVSTAVETIRHEP
jgi:hypothetical protein